MKDISDYMPEERETEILIERPRKPGRPKGARDSYPRPSRQDESWAGNKEQTPEVTREYLHFIREVSGQPPINISNVEEVQERLEWYFDFCEDEGMKPTVTGMCNALGIDRKTLLRWEKGEYRAGTHQALIVEYKRMLEEFWEMQMINGKINPVSGIFIGKNHFGYADKQEVEIAPRNPLGEVTEEDRRRIEEKYRASVPPPDEDDYKWE